MFPVADRPMPARHVRCPNCGNAFLPGFLLKRHRAMCGPRPPVHEEVPPFPASNGNDEWSCDPTRRPSRICSKPVLPYVHPTRPSSHTLMSRGKRPACRSAWDGDRKISLRKRKKPFVSSKLWTQEVARQRVWHKECYHTPGASEASACCCHKPYGPAGPLLQRYQLSIWC